MNIHDAELSYGSDYHMLPLTSIKSGTGEELSKDLYYYTLQMVNIVFIGAPHSNEWVLVDAGMPASAEHIIEVSEQRYPGVKPKGIVLTHGHFDHVGAIIDLVKYWEVPVYAHEAEMPYLTGRLRYPKPDPTVEGGLVAKLSFMLPIEPINLRSYVYEFPEDGSIPILPDWEWIHTPGHSPGHISLFRKSDRSLIVGDAFVTVKQDSLYKVFTQDQEINGPPVYLTTDWQTAKESVCKLQALKPNLAITGHGTPMEGELLAEGLQQLVDQFDEVAIPSKGKYVQ